MFICSGYMKVAYLSPKSWSTSTLSCLPVVILNIHPSDLTLSPYDNHHAGLAQPQYMLITDTLAILGWFLVFIAFN